jgi:hypothetical protein
VSSTFSKSLLTVSSRLVRLQEEGAAESFPGFCMETTRACKHARGKHCLRRAAFKTFVRKVLVRLGTCFRTLSGIFRCLET